MLCNIEMKIIIFVLTVVTISSANSLICTTTCEEGQRCQLDKCEPCPHGSFQDKPIHQFVTCKKWTEKSPHEHWILLKEGTSTSDKLWGCEDGYSSQEYAPREFECIRDVLTPAPSPPSSTLKPVTVTKTPLNNNNTTLTDSSSEQNSEGENVNIAVAVAVPLTIILIITAIVIWLVLRNRRAKGSSTKSSHASSVASLENEQLVSDTENTNLKILNDTENTNLKILNEEAQPPRILPKDINMAFFLTLVQKLGADDAMKFLYHLPNSNSEFEVDKKLSFIKEKDRDPELQYSRAGLEWAKANPEIDHKHCIKEVLAEIHRADVVDKVFPDSNEFTSHEIT